MSLFVFSSSRKRLVFPLMNRFSQILILIGFTGAAAAGGFYAGIAAPKESQSAWIDISSDSGKRFPLRTVMEKTSGSEVIPLDLSNPTHRSLHTTILDEAAKVGEELSQEGSPAHDKRRINEVSALFENALKVRIDALPDFSCQIPTTLKGKSQRSGYPDLRVEHLPTGTLAYLDPKLFEDSSIRSSLRTFYYEATSGNTKVTEDALHLLLGFPHDGKTSKWKFSTARLVDLSQIELKLKVEFSASNKELYQSKGP